MALPGQLSLGALNSSPGFYLDRVTMDTFYFTIELLTVLLMDDDIEFPNALCEKTIVEIAFRICQPFRGIFIFFFFYFYFHS